ncbi:MAG: hypothetical protein LBQ96_03380, partial [Fusobacteriaceae bacterium]|nr:hypothetical protein [Fusobacteriaceae bacterium]
MRLAFASNDGIFVSQHFGHAQRFAIVDIDETADTWRFVEKRENISHCVMGEHDPEKLERSVALLSDCKVLFAAKVGNYVKSRLQLEGIQVLEKPGVIEDLIAGYQNYLKRLVRGGIRNGKRRDITEDHPCFSEKAHNKNGRLHLPVSPACNIQCRFCTRKQNVTEQRPGVAAGILDPSEAADTVKRALELCPSITVVGIAGPGDTLATPHAVEAFRQVHAAYPG